MTSATHRPEPASWSAPLPGGWSRAFRLGEWLGDPVTPLFESWLLTRIEDRLQTFYAGLVGVEVPKPGHVVVNGWYFYGLNFLPADRAALIRLLLRHLLPRLLRHPRRTAIAIPPLAWLSVASYEADWRERLAPRDRALVAAATDLVETASSDRLVRLIDELADAAGDSFVSLTAVAGYASKVEVPLARFYTAHLEPRIGGSHLDLLAGLDPDPPAAAAHAVRSLDWIEPTLGEMDGVAEERSGGPGASSLDLARIAARHADARQRRLDAEARARAALASEPRRLRELERRLAVAQRYARVREEQVAAWTLPWPVLRRAVLRIAEDLVERGALDVVDHVWFLTRSELLAALDGGIAPDRTALAERRRTWDGQRRLAPPLTIGTVSPLLQGFIGSAEAAIRGHATRRPRADDTRDIVGIPASAGRASGPVRIVHSSEAFDRVQPGDVLVAPMTAPAWTPLFDRVAAVVTDTGGVAAHASVIAREYGLPAVVGTADATRRLRDGELVDVDGSAGIVRRHLPS